MQKREGHGAERLGDVLRGLVKRRGWGTAEHRRNAALDAAWHEAAGPTAARSRVTGFRGGILEVTVDSAALHYQLVSFRRQELLAALAERRPELGIRDLRIRQA